MSAKEIFDVVKVILKAGKEQFFGRLNVANYIRNNPANTALFLISSTLIGLIVFMGIQTFQLNKASVIYREQTEMLQKHFDIIIPDGTKEEEIPKVINQYLFRQSIEHQRCIDELEAAKQMLLVVPPVLPAQNQEKK